MNKTLLIAKHEFFSNVTRKGYLLFAVIVPILFLLSAAMLAIFGTGVSKEEVLIRAMETPIPLPLVIPSIMGAIFSLAIFISSGFLLYGIIEEKENRLIEILLTSVSERQLITGKILGLGMLGITQLVMWIIVSLLAITILPAILWMAHLQGINALQIILISVFFILGYFLFATILAGIGSVLSDTKEASPISGAITTISLLPSWIVIFFFGDPNSMVPTILSYIPVTAPTTMAIRVLMTDPPVIEIITSIIITVITIAAIIFLVEKNLKKNLLTYAKKTKLLG
ncbi:MAG TPA: ABC transporter permease [archaeon]|nr:ABC transporter permease [archaeon]